MVDEEKYEKALELLKQRGKISVSAIQRGLGIFDWFPKFSLKRSSQRMRKCREFQMTVAPIHREV